MKSQPRPKLALIFTPDGVDTITVISNQTIKDRRDGFRLGLLLEKEIEEFSLAIKSKTARTKDEKIEL